MSDLFSQIEQPYKPPGLPSKDYVPRVLLDKMPGYQEYIPLGTVIPSWEFKTVSDGETWFRCWTMEPVQNLKRVYYKQLGL